MSLNLEMFAEDFQIALADITTPADFEHFSVNCIFQKASHSENIMLEGLESNMTANAFIAAADLGNNIINIGAKVTIKAKEYRVLSIDEYSHDQSIKVNLTDENG